jgi:Spy/CpxP family protein refolding chaperone
MTDKPWKLVLLLTGIFLAGAVAGGFVTLEVGKNMLRKRMAPDNWGPARLKTLEKELALTPEQIDRLKPIVRRDVDELNRLRQQGFQETRRILERMENDIAAILTPEQKAKFEKFNEERRERARRMFEQHRRERTEKGERRTPPPANAGDGPPPPPPDDKGPGGQEGAH